VFELSSLQLLLVKRGRLTQALRAKSLVLELSSLEAALMLLIGNQLARRCTSFVDLHDKTGREPDEDGGGSRTDDPGEHCLREAELCDRHDNDSFSDPATPAPAMS